MILDISVVLAYALAMLLLGWYGMRRARNQEEFLVAGRNLGPACYLGTMAATVLGGAATVGTVRLGYVHGLSGFWLCAMLGGGILVLNLFLAKPLLKLRIYTVTQVLERRYTPLARQASAAIMFVYALMLSVVSVLAMGTVIQVLFELPFWSAILLGGSVVVIYSSIGGMWSLTLTDIVQFVIKTAGLMFVLLPICLTRVGGWDALVAKLPASAFALTTLGYDTIFTYFLIYFFGILIGQDIWQRVFTARSEGVARVAGSLAGVYCVIYGLVGALIGMCARVLLPDLADANNAFAAIVRSALPDGIRGLVIAAALAAMMSTASAGLLAASTTLTEDLLPRLRGGRASTLGMARLFTLLTGLAVLAIALLVNDVIGALTLAYNLLVGGILVPLLGAILWPRATTAGALASMLLGSGADIVFMLKDGLEANTPIYFSLGLSLVSFVLVSLLTARTQVAPRPA
ncbi:MULTISPECIES: sodium:solute symporter [Pseudomonas]|uniref:Sodium:solute symporter n=1 Tax=Pseudomonas oryzihabitans TaxID=47885 RepID=A0A178LG06_9PSED|nr:MULTISPECIES: sodium:solute symporter [Pseudomonas]OAN29184.1 sodium:solute symporter [Pseudomonas oryzihabitans]SEO44931.1 solute:Na+ symporter, SSS family [Pseudomonas sp. Snoq117.2]